MELCPICGAVNAKETIQCPRVRTAPVCRECHKKCMFYKFSLVAQGQCSFHLSEEYKEIEQREVNARGIERLSAWKKQREEWYEQDNRSGHRRVGK